MALTRREHGNQALTFLATAIFLISSFNFFLGLRNEENRRIAAENEQLKAKLQLLERGQQPQPNSETKLSAYQVKASSINSFWWPSLDSGLLSKISHFQNPPDCSSPDAKFFVWRSLPKSHDDTRGLSAFGHTATWHLVHALTDGDQFDKGPRVLLQDEELWPMAKGCQHGPETRECYFEPLSKCTIANANPMDDAKNTQVLKSHGDEYDRSIRTLYSAQSPWWRPIKDVYAFTGLAGGQRGNSEIALVAALFAYYFNPRPWLREEIHRRLQKSIPADLDPERTIGVPIRRSDKCQGHNIEGSAKGEMQCHPLETYREGVERFLQFDPAIENLIVTSEDKAACTEFVEMMKKEHPTLRIVLNVGDVQQGTGSGSKLESYTEGATNADVVASALTSMHMHMRAKYFVITSSSTWTSTVTLMARAYGFSISDIFVIDLNDKANRLAGLAKTGCYS